MPTRFPHGLTTASTPETMGSFILPDPTKAHVYFEDFDYFAAANWTITTTEAGAGSATEALTDADGGVLLVTNAAGDNDNDFFNKVGESFTFTAGKKTWFKARIATSDATQTDLVLGLQITDTTPLAVTDGVYFIKPDDAATVNFVVIKDSAATTTSAVATMANGVFVTLGFYYNGKDEIQIFVNDAQVGTSAITNLPDDEVLTVSFGIQNGEAVAKTLSVDYIMAAKER